MKNLVKNSKPLILAINCNKTSGGGKVMLSLAKAARDNGFHVITAAPEGRKESETPDHIVVTKRWQKALNWRLSRLVGDDLFIPFSETDKLIRFIEKNTPDLVHIHGLHGYYVDYIKLLGYLEKKSIPVVWTQHDCWSFTGKCTYYSRAKCEKWKNHCSNCPQLKFYPASIWFDRTPKMFERKKECFSSLSHCVFISVSNWLKDEMKQSFLAKMDIRVIENGVDTSIFSPQGGNIAERHGIQNKKIILGVAANWSERKGFDDFFRLNEMVNKNNTAIVLIGVNDKQLSKCRNAGIVGISRTSDQAELAQWYSACDVFFNPSVQETFGLVTIEAMACGAPIIGYRATATTEILNQTPNFCIEPCDLSSVDRAIRQIFKQPKQMYSVANRDKVLHYYDLKTQYRKYIDLYYEMLENKTMVQ